MATTGGLKGRKALLRSYHAPFDIIEEAVPDPEPGAIILKVVQAGICGSDLHHWRGDHEGDLGPLPCGGKAIGHEGFGVVARLGKGVVADFVGNPIREGSRIVHAAVFHCGQCRMCKAGDTNQCRALKGLRPHDQFPFHTGFFADYYYLPPNHPVFVVPDDLSDNALTLVNCALGATAEGLIRAGVKEGDTVGIIGAGGLGLCASAFARDLGAANVVMLDLHEERLSAARTFGSTLTLNAGKTSAAERKDAVDEITDGYGCDVIVEVAGVSKVISEAITLIRNGGTVMTMGCVVGNQPAAVDLSKMLRGKKLIGHGMYRPSTLPLVLDFLSRRKKDFPMEQLVSKSFALEDISQAFQSAEWLGATPAPSRVAVRAAA